MVNKTLCQDIRSEMSRRARIHDEEIIYMADCRWVRRKNDVENGGNIGG